MLDKTLIPLVRTAVKAGFTRADIVCEVKQGYQPIAQGLDTGPTLYFTKLGMDREYGSPRVDQVWDAEAGQYVRQTTQRIESTFQAQAILKQDPAQLDGLTASDLAQAAVAVLQDEDTLASLRDQGLALFRITSVRNLQILNGGLQNEAAPTFDFVIGHNRVTTALTQGATPVGLRIQGF